MNYTKLFLFWSIGKKVYENKENYRNIVQKYSDYYSYYFGNSYLFTRENVHLMKRFYMNFPIFYSKMECISWEQYQLLLMIQNKKERFFYYSLSLLFHSDYEETANFIQNQYFVRI